MNKKPQINIENRYNTCTKVHLHTQSGFITQPDNSDITQLVGIHVRYAQCWKKHRINKTDKLKIIEKIIRLFVKQENGNRTIIPIQRNEICFCGSGLKYKKCHALKLEPKNKIACKLFDNETGEIEIKIFKTKTVKAKSNLRWVDIGVGSYDKVE